MGWARSRTAAIKFSWQNRLWLQKTCSLTFFFPCYWRFQRLYGKTHKWDRIDEETFVQDYTKKTLGSVTQEFQQNFESFQLRARFSFFNALKNVFFWGKRCRRLSGKEKYESETSLAVWKIWPFPLILKWNEMDVLENIALKWNDIDDMENIAFLHY